MRCAFVCFSEHLEDIISHGKLPYVPLILLQIEQFPNVFCRQVFSKRLQKVMEKPPFHVHKTVMIKHYLQYNIIYCNKLDEMLRNVSMLLKLDSAQYLNKTALPIDEYKDKNKPHYILQEAKIVRILNMS